MSHWNDDFAEAMRTVYADHREDFDVVTLFREAIMNRIPWQLWDLETGEPAEGADTEEAIRVLETALTHLGAMEHPGLLHIYIHLMAMSPHPQRALSAGDALRSLVPDAGHLHRLPSHIYELCGHYETVVSSNHEAIVSDRKFLEREGAINFYSLYRCHDYHFRIYSAMFLGQYRTATDTAEEMISNPARGADGGRVPSHGRLARRLRLPEATRLHPLRQMVRDHRPGPTREPRAVLRDDSDGALC
jgi:hypothetical protein